ncbi:MAG: M14 family zinc carboxypeptidase [Chloroflexota bacterium]|jgi:hypothetical protein
MQNTYHRRIRYLVLTGLCLILLVSAVSASASTLAEPRASGPWWDVVPEDENPSPYYDSILYSEIAPKLREIEVNSNRVKVEVIGQSAGGRDLFLVTLSAPEAMGRLGQYQAIRNTMLKDPEKAQEMIDKFGDFKVPVFINGSIHGNEYPGVDAAIRLIETLAYDDSEEVQEILENVILLVNVVQNPDGRVLGTRSNANGFDVNRDFFTQSQPESKITARIFAEWNPMVVLDLHGFVNPMLIEPCTPPHNPNYEYDLYIKWAYDQAKAMEAELIAQTDETEAIIPYRDWDLGWDDWPPSYVPMFAMYHGSYGHTLETPHRDERGVDAHYAAVWGALNFVAENREEMIHDQIEIFRRGFLDLLQQPIPPELLPTYPQYQDLMIQDFPAAHVIPAGAPFQVSSHQAARLVDFLLYNGVQVERANKAFSLDGVEYPAGTYIVWLDQPKRGLANVILEDGLDLSDIPGLYFYSPPSVWSHPLLWGTYRAVMEEKIDVQTSPVNKADAPQGSLDKVRKPAAYAYLPTSIAAFQATNDLLARSVALYRAAEPFTDSGRDFGAGAVILPNDSSLANELANGYALDVFALKNIPAGVIPMVEQRIAVYGDEGVRHALETLGFDYDSVGTSDLNAGAIANYDVFINRDLRWRSLDPAGQASVSDWFAAGGNFVGLGYRGRAIDFAVDAGWVDVEYGYISGNAILNIDYDPGDSVAAGFQEDGYAFVYRSVWFTDWGGMDVSARIDTDEILVSGFWEDWQISGANGMPVILHDSDDVADVTLIGINNTFRGHPENTFRILGNAIYNGLD